MSQGPIGLQAIWNVKDPEPFKATAAELSELVQRSEPGAILWPMAHGLPERDGTRPGGAGCRRGRGGKQTLARLAVHVEALQ